MGILFFEGLSAFDALDVKIKTNFYPRTPETQ
jgi:hypothetical protein